jgi:hemerythrin
LMWNDGLKIGVPLIDSEHKELCSRIDQLLDACNKGQGRAEIEKTVAFLEEYTIKHFSDEERLQRSSGYPKCAEHKEMHEYFKAKVADLKKSLEESGANIGNISETNFFLMNWLINHIQKVDKELAAYIK